MIFGRTYWAVKWNFWVIIRYDCTALLGLILTWKWSFARSETSWDTKTWKRIHQPRISHVVSISHWSYFLLSGSLILRSLRVRLASISKLYFGSLLLIWRIITGKMQFSWYFWLGLLVSTTNSAPYRHRNSSSPGKITKILGFESNKWCRGTKWGFKRENAYFCDSPQICCSKFRR